ncbi:uncharacterized protein LOC112179276 [Rosa chinensis]|nr:uncharacterized protein LOC112179276 [Rosa chinensis]
MAMTLRSVLGTLGSMNSNKRDILVRAFKVWSTSFNPMHKCKDALLTTTPGSGNSVWLHSIPESVVEISLRRRGPRYHSSPQPFYLPMHHSRIIKLAQLALEKFNERKNAKLQLVRVGSADYQRDAVFTIHNITLEAADSGVIKVYKARLVKMTFRNSPMTLKSFDLVVGADCLVDLLYGTKL